MSEQLVEIEYDVYGYDEAGITYYIEYDDFETLIKRLQEYIREISTILLKRNTRDIIMS